MGRETFKIPEEGKAYYDKSWYPEVLNRVQEPRVDDAGLFCWEQ